MKNIQEKDRNPFPERKYITTTNKNQNYVSPKSLPILYSSEVRSKINEMQMKKKFSYKIFGQKQLNTYMTPLLVNCDRHQHKGKYSPEKNDNEHEHEINEASDLPTHNNTKSKMNETSKSKNKDNTKENKESSKQKLVVKKEDDKNKIFANSKELLQKQAVKSLGLDNAKSKINSNNQKDQKQTYTTNIKSSLKSISKLKKSQNK